MCRVTFILFALFLNCSTHDLQLDEGKHHRHHNKHDFSNAQEWSKKFDDPKRDLWQRPHNLMTLMDIQNGEVVADIGAGTGYLLPYLSKKVGTSGKVYALDVEDSLVTFMKSRVMKNNLRNVIVSKIPYDSPGSEIDKVDKVILLNTWHHISNPKKYSKYLHVGLRKGSSIFIIEPEKGAGGPGPKDHHRQVYSETIKELSAIGFECKQLIEELPYQYIAGCQKI